MKSTIFLVLTLFVSITYSQQHDPNKYIIPVGGNAWIARGGQISDQGLINWDDTEAVCTSFIRFSQTGTLKLSLYLKAEHGKSRIRVTMFGKSVELPAEGNEEREYFAGEWAVTDTGYVSIDIQGISRTGKTFGVLSKIAISGDAISKNLSYVENNDDKYFHWGRRGPSVHLRYDTRRVDSIEWFYSEITVPEHNDVIGSYFMANGFAEGYFGMQVNSESERRVLFSVWSPYQTDDPKTIPDDYKISLVKKGADVYSGEFGNEGSGGQSYLRYNWKAGTTYKFLLQAKPLADSVTVYTAYFHAPEKNQWMLIASFKRPHTSTYLKRLYSFLENFEPETGNIERMALYGNQWVMDLRGGWTELRQAVFTADNTARKNYRKDYAGGVRSSNFYLRNCGFFNDSTPLDRNFVRPSGNNVPMIDFSKLPF